MNIFKISWRLFCFVFGGPVYVGIKTNKYTGQKTFTGFISIDTDMYRWGKKAYTRSLNLDGLEKLTKSHHLYTTYWSGKDL